MKIRKLSLIISLASGWLWGFSRCVQIAVGTIFLSATDCRTVFSVLYSETLTKLIGLNFSPGKYAGGVDGGWEYAIMYVSAKAE